MRHGLELSLLIVAGIVASRKVFSDYVPVVESRECLVAVGLSSIAKKNDNLFLSCCKILVDNLHPLARFLTLTANEATNKQINRQRINRKRINETKRK